MVYKSRRIVPHHKKKVWVGKGRRRARLTHVNIGVNRKLRHVRLKRYTSSLRIKQPKSYSFKRMRVRPLTARTKILSSKRYNPRNFGAFVKTDPGAFKGGAGVFETYGQKDEASAVKKFAQATNEDIIDSYDDFLTQLKKNKMDKMKLQEELDELGRKYSLADSEDKKEKLLREKNLYLYSLQKKNYDMESGRRDEEIQQIKRAAERIAKSGDDAAIKVAKEMAELEKKQAAYAVRHDAALDRIKSIENKQDLEALRRKMRMMEDQAEIMENQLKEKARKMGGWGFDFKIAGFDHKDRGFDFGKFGGF